MRTNTYIHNRLLYNKGGGWWSGWAAGSGLYLSIGLFEVAMSPRNSYYHSSTFFVFMFIIIHVYLFRGILFSVFITSMKIFEQELLNQVCAWFLRIASVHERLYALCVCVCVCVCVFACVSAPEAINN